MPVQNKTKTKKHLAVKNKEHYEAALSTKKIPLNMYMALSCHIEDLEHSVQHTYCTLFLPMLSRLHSLTDTLTLNNVTFEQGQLTSPMACVCVYTLRLSALYL